MDETQLDIRGLLGVLRRQARLIIGVIVAVVAIATFVVFTLKPIYTATALVLVDTQQRDIFDPSIVDQGASTANARVDSEVELAKAPTVLLRVVRNADLLNDPEFAPEPGLVSRVLTFLNLRQYEPPTGEELLQSTLGKLRGSVSVRRQGLTYLIVVEARSAVPASAARIANAVADAYIEEQLDAKIASIQSAKKIIEARVADASQALARSEEAIDSFIADNIETIAQETGRGDLRDLFGQVSQATIERASLASLVDTADNGLRQQDWESLTRSLQDEALATLKAQREGVQASLQAAASGSQAEIDLRAELARVDDELATAAQSSIAELRTQVSAAQGRVSDLRSQLRNDVLSADLSATTLTTFYGLQQNASIARSQYQALLSRNNDLDQQSNSQRPDSRVASAALVPNEASFPNPRLILSLAGLAALALGLGLAFVYENLIGGVVSAPQLESLLKSRRVLTVPVQKESRGSLSLADLLVTSPLTVFSEAIRKVRLSVDQSVRRKDDDSSDRRGKVILVSSAAPGEGKTTTSLSLARAYAQSGATTLLIDCDLRKPSVHRHLGWEPDAGLIDYLSNAKGADASGLLSIIRVDELSGIGVLVGSRRSDAATDTLVAGATFGKLIDAARKSFDVIVLDTPPVQPVVDGVYLAQFADAVVFVVRWASTPQPEVKQAVSSLSEGMRPGVEMTVVLNQSSDGRRGYSGKYGYYYSEA